MKKCLVLVQTAAVLALGSGCIIVPGQPHRTVVHHRPPAPPTVVVNAPRPPVAPPPVVVVEAPKPPPRPPVVVVKAREPVVVVTIDAREREIIREYVVNKRGHGHDDNSDKHKHGKQKGLPKGIAKKVERGHDLPPGWQKKCVRGQIMPTEIYQRCEPLPQGVVVRLPAPPPGTIIVTIEGKAVRLLQATLEILDVFDVI